MHLEARHFTEWVKQVLPDAFHNVRALDVGGGDINGCNKPLFSWDEGAAETFECNDIGPAPNATVISATKDLTFADGSFDTIISTECFEHDAQYAESLRKISAMLAPGGILVFTCASTGRPEHGTRRTTPKDSWGTRGQQAEFQDYYKNLTLADVAEVLPLDNIFATWSAYYHAGHKDLFFVGIKQQQDGNAPAASSDLPAYGATHTHPVTLD